MASTIGIQTIPHVWGTPVMIAASLHVASTIPNSPRMDNPQPFLQEPGMEYDRTNNPLRENISSETQPFKFENGYLNVPEKHSEQVRYNLHQHSSARGMFLGL